MEFIHFEKQEGSLCAQHCLNTLLQGAYFTAVDLAQHAYELDEAERCTMAQGDVNSEEYIKFMNQPSSNMDDSGFFSIQVICRALQVWNLTVISYLNPNAESARKNPAVERAFICNLQQHWFTIRKLGHQWFNLNSVSRGPELISETYLSLFLKQLQNDGYSIFVVRGVFPDCKSDQILSITPADPATVKSTSTRGKEKNSSKSDAASSVNVDEVRKKREQFFATKFKGEGEVSPSVPSTTTNASVGAEETEEEMLQRALELSMMKT